MKNLILALIGALALFYACKNEPGESPSPAYSNYSNLEVGNYWVYDQFSLDTNGVYTALGQTDSNYVEKDTLIRGEIYFKMMVIDPENPTTHTPIYLRDSLHYLVDVSGRILFSSENDSDTLATRYYMAAFQPVADTFAFISARMEGIEHVIQTAAGTFTTKNYRETFHMWPKFGQHGNKRFLNHYYAKDVGIVEETLYFFYSNPGDVIVRKLKKFGKN